jgi:hypothetical protein
LLAAWFSTKTKFNYANLIIAPVAVGLGNTTVKSPAVEVLSPPKSIAQIALFELVVLYNRHPLAVTVAVLNVKSAKSTIAVVPEVVGVTFVKALPPEE